jgi:spectinomycin phosphotransferase
VRAEPVSLPSHLLAQELSTHWGMEVPNLAYAPVGAGSYHWLAVEASGRRWFISADDLTSLGTSDAGNRELDFLTLEAAYKTATALREAGLAFVAAPVADRTGRLVRRVLSNWAVAVFPWLEGESGNFGVWYEPLQQVEAARIVGQLHRATPPDSIRLWDSSIPHQVPLFDAFEELDRPWTSGPYGERARALLSRSRDEVEALFSRYASLVNAVLVSRPSWVVTHGEPHSSNFMSAGDGSMYLIDWDTVRLGPPERDLAVLLDGNEEALAAYQEVAGPHTPSSEGMELFHIRWVLSEICVYIRRFRAKHLGSEDDQASWDELSQCLTVD